jgi:hypothetical protein
MKVRNCLVGAAAAVLAFGSIARANDSMSLLSSDDNTTPVASADASASNLLTAPLFADDATPPPPPLTAGLDKIGVGSLLDKAGLSITGFVEVGYLYDMTVPGDVTPAKTAPGNKIFFPGPYKNAPMLNQLDLAIARNVDASKGKFDVGFMVEGLYGRDAFFTHSNGILDETNKGGGTGPDNQLDLEQAYVTFAIPVGSGVTLKVGKFTTLMGQEVIDATGNMFYTHSYSFSYGVPLTQTGILASYNLTSALSLTAGVTRGWNQTLYDNNGSADFLGEVSYTVNDKLTVVGNLSVGPQTTGDNAHYWVVAEAIPTYKVSDQLTIAVDALYGLANSYGQWYGFAGYGGYTINKYVTANSRLEYYHDGNGFTTGAGGGHDVNYWELTLGAAVTPLPDNSWFNSLTIRPEIRFDMADHAAFDSPSDFDQCNFAIDAYWKF